MHDYLSRLHYLENPEIYEVNRLAPHSDHVALQSGGRSLPAINLCGEWEVACYQRPELVDTGLISSGKPEGKIHVPGHLQFQGFGIPKYVNTQYPWDGIEALTPPAIPKGENLTALYIKTFELTDAFFAGRLRLILEGAESCCFVYLNGGFIGYSEDSFTPAEFDISGAAKIGSNRLAIIVAQFCSGSWLEDQDFWRLSGLFRSVGIQLDAPVRMEDIHVSSGVDASLEKGRVKTKLRVFSDRETTYAAWMKLGQTDCARRVEGVLSTGEQTIELSAEMEHPYLWSAESPRLYECEVHLCVDSCGLEQIIRQKVGFRRLEIQDGVMLLNRKRLLLRGVNRHEWSCKTGRAISKHDMERDIILLKQNNFNAVRTSHYPNQSYFYQLCDQYGLYVVDEVNLETHGTWMVSGKVRLTEQTLPGSLPNWEASVLARAEAMFERDKNHASILFWSCGNESFGGETIYKMSEWFRAQDSSRLVHYEGIFYDRSFEDSSDVESRMYVKPKEAKKYLEERQKKPLILCEYAHAMGNSFGNVDEYIALEEYRQYQGGFIWDWIDQAIAFPGDEGKDILRYGGDFGDRPTDWNFCGNGLLFSDRTPTPKMDEAKWLNAPFQILCEQDGITIVNRMMFSGSDAYLFEWSLLEDGVAVEQEVFTLMVPAGATARKTLSLQTEHRSGELTLLCRAMLARNEAYAPSGHEVAHGFQVIRGAKLPESVFRPAQLVQGDVNIGVRMKHATALIRRDNGMLYSLKGEEELLLGAVYADFWRAPTDNDRGNDSNKRWANWKIASLYRNYLGMEVLEQEAKIVLRFSAPTTPVIHYTISYQFGLEDSVKITLSLDPIQGTIPCFGLSLTMPCSFDMIRWYGNLQSEASCDRQNAARLGRGEGIVKDQLIPYLKPQDCGNKTMIRELTVENEQRRGIRFRSDEPFEASVLHYSSHELEYANHVEDLPPIRKTVVSIYQQKCGIGGDDSWGAPVHDQYQITTEHGLEFSFLMYVLSET